MAEAQVFKAEAFNAMGDTFTFRFRAHGWDGIEAVARGCLEQLISMDPFRSQTGPWDVRDIGVGH